MTDRQELINICARGVFDGGFQEADVPAVVDDTFRKFDPCWRDWYAKLSPAQVGRFDNDVFKRVQYLHSLKNAR
jgi:hypothetical protein